MYKRALVCGLLLSGLMLIGLAGCASKVTQENYGKIRDGMTLAEVQKVLGPGKMLSSVSGTIEGLGGSTAVYEWVDGGKRITITFVNDKVTTRLATGL